MNINVHIIRSKEVSEELYWSILDLLNQFKGPARFIPSESFVTYEAQFIEKEIVKTEVDFTKMEGLVDFLIDDELEAFDYPFGFPMEREIMGWEQLLLKCKTYRRNKDIGNNEFVILLTDIANNMNWFKMMDKTYRNAFIHTDDWDYYLFNSSKYPIAYQVAEILLQSFLVDETTTLNDIVHHKPIGCINDFSTDKKDVTLRLRTADICGDCQELILEKQVPFDLVHQVLSIIEGIRKQMLFKDRFKYHFSPGEITFNLVQRKIIFKDLQDLLVRLTPLEATIYYFFLTHPDGLPLNRLSEYENELYRIYQKCSVANSDNNIAAMRNSIKALVSMWDNSLNEKISRIKSKLIKALGADLASYYYIARMNDEKMNYGIMIDRDLLTLT